jgi:nicotinate-nucleotide--dimethylbenzimidazole phosphoribosyltransferase
MTSVPFQSKAVFIDALSDLSSADLGAIATVRSRQNILTKPQGSLGRLETIVEWLTGWQRHGPTLNTPKCIVFAGNHGITAQGISAYPSDVTKQMVANFEAGGAAINQLCNMSDIALDIIPVDIDSPTKDITCSPAMNEAECLDAIDIGFNAVDDSSDIILLGEMGIGNTSIAAALCLANFGGNAAEWVGAGTGISNQTLKHKINLVQQAANLHRDNIADSFDLLRFLGGRELAAIAGAVLKARTIGVPIILDGFIATSAASTLIKSNQSALSHCIISHLSAEHGHKRLCDILNMQPLLDLNMRLGEASGAATAFPIIKAALAIYNGMASFEDAGVSTEI